MTQIIHKCPDGCLQRLVPKYKVDSHEPILWICPACYYEVLPTALAGSKPADA